MAQLDQLERTYRDIGYRTIRTSAVDGVGVDEVMAPHCVVTGYRCLAVISGVGKSTLINRIERR
jgi:putative ribosome biogenesis GTPase RsgA